MQKPTSHTNIINAEINAIVYLLKQQKNWTTLANTNNIKLLKDFYILKLQLKSLPNTNEINPLQFMRPFLHIMMSDCTDGASTRSAISSITKFITYNFINKNNEKCDEIVSEICIAIQNTRFIGNDASSDETVLMRNVNLIKTLILSPIGNLMSNDAICLSIQSCFRICFQPKLSELLRSVCFSSLAEVVHHLFSRLDEFDPSAVYNVNHCDRDTLKMKLTRKMPIVNYKKRRKDAPKIISTNDEDTFNNKDNKIKSHKKYGSSSSMDEKPSPNLLNSQQATSLNSIIKSAPTSMQNITEKCGGMENIAQTHSENTPSIEEHGDGDHGGDAGEPENEIVYNCNENESHTKDSDDPTVKEDDDVWNMPYNIACLYEFLQYITILIDPYDRKEYQGYIVKNTIDLLHVAIESCLEHIPKYVLIMDVIKDRIFFNLLQILKMNGGELLSSTINVCFIIFASSRQYFPAQFENFLIILVNISSSSRHTNGKRELVLDCLSQILTLPRIVSELFANFDCNLYHEDVVQLLVNKLKHIIENSTRSSILREFATDNLLLIVESLTYDAIQDEKGAEAPQDHFTKRKLHLINQKCKKNKILSCCDEFNNNASSAVKMLQQCHIIEKNDCPNFNDVSLGQFLFRYSDRLDKKILGEFLGKRNNGRILGTYLRNCNFANMNVEQALRLMLHYFRLPGESPVISLILDQFSAYFLELNPHGGYDNHDAVFTLAYAIIMLNVDQHNENAKQTTSMTCEQFIRNVKGINNGKDYPVNILKDIFNSIHTYEIILPEEREGFIREIYFWNRSLQKVSYYSNDLACSYVTFDGAVMDCNRGDDIDCIKLSFAYEIFQIVWQSICSCLSLSIGEGPDKSRLIALINAYSKCIRLASKAGMIDIVDDMMSKLIEFSNILNPEYSIEDVIMSIGFNITTRITCQVAFRTVVTNGDFLRDSWGVVLRSILVMFKARLLPDELLQTFDFLSDTRSSYIVQPYVSPQSNAANSKADFLDSAAAANDNNNFFSSIYQLLIISNDSVKPPNFDVGYEQAVKFIKDCNIDVLMLSGKNLQPESLIQKFRAIIDCYFQLGNDTKSKVFLLEITSRIVIDNSVRFTLFWAIIKNFYYKILTACCVNTNGYLVEKIVVTLLRILIATSQQLYNTRSEDVLSCVEHFSSLLRSVILIDTNLLVELSRHLACGIFEHIASNCDHITSTKDWVAILKLMEIIGAGNVILNKAAMFSVPVVISNSENAKHSSYSWTEHDAFNEASNDMWTIMKSTLELYRINSGGDDSNSYTEGVNDYHQSNKTNNDSGGGGGGITILDDSDTAIHSQFLPKYLQSYLKSIEVLSFLTTNNNNRGGNLHSNTTTTTTNYIINYYNFIPISYCLLVFGQASHNIHVELSELEAFKSNKKESSKKNKSKNGQLWSQISQENIASVRQTIDHSILDIFECVYNLFGIFMDNATTSAFYAEESSSSSSEKLNYCLPFLRLFAFYCIDERDTIRDRAYGRLHVLLQGQYFRNATAKNWESCFNDVLLPLLASILQLKSNPTRRPTTTIKTTFLKIMSMVGKIFLQNITILHSLPDFQVLWFNFLQLYIDLLNISQNDDIVLEAIPEMIKNILFVMFTLGVFDIGSCLAVDAGDNNTDSSSRVLFFNETYNRIKHYLPSLRENLLGLVEQQNPNNHAVAAVAHSPGDTEPSPSVHDNVATTTNSDSLSNEDTSYTNNTTAMTTTTTTNTTSSGFEQKNKLPLS